MKTRGFTLIEVLVYLALFGLLIGGVVLAAYDVFESSGRGSTHAIVQEEGDFILAKMSWALSGARAIVAPSITTPPCSSTTSSLVVINPSIGTIAITRAAGNITIAKGSAAAVPINSSSVSVSNLTFVHCWAGGTSPESVQENFTLAMRMPNGMVVSQDFSNTDYVRR